MEFNIKLVICAVIFVTYSIGSAKAQIVQPNSVKNKNLFDVPNKVSVNPLKLKEVDALRKDIKEAVAGKKFFVKSQHFPGNTNEDTGPTQDLDGIKNETTQEPILIINNSTPKENKSFSVNQNLTKVKEDRVSSLDKSINDSITHALVGSTESNKTSHTNSSVENESYAAKGQENNSTKAGNIQKDVKVPVKIESESNQLKEGPVVQPKWTKGNQNQKSSANVEVTPEKLEETAEIRAEIQQAVKEGTNAISSPGDGGVSERVDEFYQHRFRLRQVMSNLLGLSDNESAEFEESESEIDPHSAVTTDIRNNGSDSNNPPNIVPNVVNSQIIMQLAEEDGDGERVSEYDLFNFDFPPLNSEVLRVRSIEDDISFSFGTDVNLWKIVENQGNASLTGVSGKNLTILSKSSSGDFQELNAIVLDKSIVDLEIFIQWNSALQSAEEIVVVAFKDQIITIKASTFEVITEWDIGRPVTGVKYYQVENKSFLAVLTNPLSGAGIPTINIYQFDLKTKDFWLSQVIPLEHSCSEVIFLHTGRDIVLAVPQVNTTVIFTYNPAMQNEARFQQVFVVQSEGVQSISGFQMGGFSYIAIGGTNPKILRYYRGQFFSQTIFGQTFQLVERFIPIPARTYRDDLILLVQHRINFDTHSLAVVEMLIWDGKAFQSSPTVPCHVGNFSTKLGASCMVDIDRDDGIKGAAVMSSGGHISLIVPRADGPSGLFRIEIELIERNFEKELDQAYKSLKKLMENQETVIAEALNYVEQQSYGSQLSLEYLKSPEFSFNGEIEHIFINDEEWTENIDFVAFLDLLEETAKEIQALENETMPYENGQEDMSSKNDTTNYDLEGSKSRQKREIERDVMEIDNISVENLLVEQINGVPVEEIFFLKENDLKFNGTIIIEGNLEVNGLESRGALQENALIVNSLEIDGDLNFERINGVPWKDLISGVVLINLLDKLEDLKVEGDVILENGLYMNTLNGLNFPDDYLLSSGPVSSVVQVRKTFHNSLTASTISIGGDINGVNPNDMITLSGNQWIPGRITFTDLEVTDMLEINGIISGDGLDQFVPNPNLLHSSQIDSNCEFDHLEVLGPVIITDQLNDENLDAIFDDIIYRTEESVSMSGAKTIKKAIFENPIELSDEKISNIHLNEFVTMDTNQELNITSISGNIYFNLLELEGLFDLVNITELYENSIKLDGDQNTGAELIFETSDHLRTHNLEVLKELDKESVDTFRTVFDNFEINIAKFDHLSSDQVKANCEVTGSRVLNNIDLVEFDKNRLSLTRNQNITANVTVDTVVIENDFNIQFLNGFSADFLLGFLEELENLPIMIQTGKVKINSLHVIGDIAVNRFNGFQFDEEIQDRVIWLNRPNFIRNELKFLDPIVIDGDLFAEGFLNNEDFPTFLEDIIFKTDDEIVIKGPKRFLSQVRVLEDATIHSVNQIPMSEIATKKNANFGGSLQNTGNLGIDELTLGYYLNKYDVSDLLDLIEYDDELKTFVFTQQVLFEGLPVVEQLYVQGSVSGIGNLDKFLSNLVYKDKSTVVTGRKVFQNAPNFQNGIFVESLNGLNLSSYLNNIVYVNEVDKVRIETPIVFTGIVEAASTVVEDVLHTSNLMGCDLYEWIENGLRTDLPMDIHAKIQFDQRSLDYNSLNVLNANGIFMKDVISLHTSQNLSGPFYFSEVYLDGSLGVGQQINGVDLLSERENTLMVNGDQHITAPTTMQSVRVLRDLNIETLVNGKDLNNIATLTGDLQLQSPLSFKNIIVKNVVSDDLISGINFTRWYQNSLWTHGRDIQVVTGNWTAEYTEIEDVMTGNGLVNGVSLDDIRAQIDEMSPEKVAFFGGLDSEMRKLCLKTQDLVKGTQKRVYFVKYFKKSFKIVEDGPVNRLIIFMDGSQAYLMINVFCYSSIYRWNLGEFVKVNGMETGLIGEVLAIPVTGGGVHIVTTTASNNFGCSASGTNIWYLSSDQLRLVKDYDFIGEYGALYHSPEHLEMFYGIDEKNNLVVEIDLRSTNVRSWNLPSQDEQNFRFLPYNAEVGVALSNGQSLLVINNRQVGKSRQRRYLTGKVLENYAPIEPTTNITLVETIFPARPYDHGNTTDKIDKSELIDNIEKVLLDLIKDLNKEVQHHDHLELEEVESKDVNDIISKFKAAIDDMKRNNITLQGFNRDLEAFSNFTSSSGLKPSDVKTATRILRAFTEVKNVQIAISKYNSSPKWKESEMVGGESPINFESILTILANVFTDVFNNMIRRRDDVLGSPHNNTSGGKSNFDKEMMQSIVKDLENALTSLNEVYKTENDLPEFEEFPYFKGLKKLKGSDDFIDDSVNTRSDEPKLSTQNSSKLKNDISKLLADLANALGDEIRSKADLKLVISNEDHRYISQKSNKLFEEMMKKNISFGGPVLDLTVFPELKDLKVSSSALNAAKKLLNTSLLIVDLKDHPNEKLENPEMVGLESPITFEGILTILAAGYSNLLNALILRRDVMLGDPLPKTNNVTLDNSDLVREKIAQIIEQIEDKLNAIKTNVKNLEVEDSGVEELEKFKENFSAGTISTHKSYGNQDIESLTNLPDPDEIYLQPTSLPPPPIPQYLEEPIIAYEIPEQDLLVAYNDFLPGKSSGEVLALKVGSPKNRKTLVAVTHSKEHLVAGQHDTIKLYYDIEQGHLFQTISAFRPRSLTAIHMRDETILAFVEDKRLVRVFIYRGVEGFVEFIKFSNDQPVTVLTSASLPESGPLNSSLRHFLIVAAANYTQFYEAMMAGESGLDVELNCGG